MHQHDGRLCGRQPADELVLVGDIGCEEPAMALVVAIVGDAAALRRERADHVEASFPGLCELIPEECTPAALEVALAWTMES